MGTLIINLMRETQQVDVRHADGKLDRVQVVARPGRVELRDGMQVDARWLQKNPNALNIVLSPNAVKPVQAPAPAASTTTQGDA